MTAVVQVSGLVKRYGPIAAVDGLDLEIAAGEVFALLGPNGAGKTTTIEILEGHRRRTAGDVTVLGADPGTAGSGFRARIGIVLQSGGLEGELTAHEALETYGRMYPRRLPTGALLELVGLQAGARTRIKVLSGGQRRRLEMALGLVGDPELIFLDEPTTGFDPAARRQAWTVIDNLRTLGKTILLTTHYMDEAEHLSDRVAVIRRGRIVAEGPPGALGGPESARTVVSFRLPPQIPPPEMAGLRPDGPGFIVTTDDATGLLHELTSWAVSAGVELGELRVERPTLEEIYLRLVAETGEEP